MRVAIDCRILVSHYRGGILVYTERLVEKLAAIDRGTSYRLLFSGLRLRPDQVKLDVGPNFSKWILPIPDREFPGKELLWREAALPLALAAGRIDVYHLPALHELPSWRLAKKVITIHDLRSLHLDDQTPQDLDAIRRSARIADTVVVVSEFTRRDVVRFCGIDERKVRTIPVGVDEVYRRIEDPETLAEFRRRRGLERPFFFSLGLVPRKNVDRLLEAYARFRHRGEVSLVLAGHEGGPWCDRYRAFIRAHGLEGQVRMVGPVTEEELCLFYNTAHAFVFPSLLEGFGIPVVEAMRCGTAVITSNGSALPEVSGGASLLVDPEDAGAIAGAMERIVEDAALRGDLVERGRANATRYSWDRMASEILDEYRSLAGK
jgi:glycosyltransferase involved in cell wall biosynthesis